ncbi:MAG: 6-bladed beta-propeller, partial [Candidatus Thorarchaeota archaeon]
MIALMSCNYNQEDDVTISVVTVDTLVFADTVGILMGDSNYVFGTLSTVRVIPEGIVVLDGIKCRVSLFDLSGEFITSQGRQGEAPGEYSQPWAICRLQGGEYFIFDHGAQKMTLLDSSLNYLSSFNATMRVPLKLAAGADSMVVIKEIVIRFDNEQLLAGYRIYSLNAYSGQEGYVYRDCQLPMGAPQVDLKSEFCFFTTDEPGNVYIADYDSDEYSIEILSPEGELQRVVDMGSPPREDFDIEI